MPERSKGSGSSRWSGAAPPASLATSGIFSVVALNVAGSAAGRGGIDSVDVERCRPRRRCRCRDCRGRGRCCRRRCRGASTRRSDEAELRRHRNDRLRQRARAERLGDLAAFERPLRRAAGAVHRVVGVDLRAELLRLGPLLALAARQREELRREQLEALDVAPLGVDLEQLGADREALGVAAHRLLEDFLGLQVAAVGEVDVGLGDRIDVADRVELRQRVGHRRRAAGGIAGVDALAAAGAEERVGLQAALEERGLAAVLLRSLRVAIGAVAGEQQAERAEAEIERVAAVIESMKLGSGAGRSGGGLATAAGSRHDRRRGGGARRPAARRRWPTPMRRSAGVEAAAIDGRRHATARRRRRRRRSGRRRRGDRPAPGSACRHDRRRCRASGGDRRARPGRSSGRRTAAAMPCPARS